MTKPVPYTVKSRRGDGMPYDAACKLCPVTSSGWDYKRNALASIRHHVVKEHAWEPQEGFSRVVLGGQR